MFKLNKIFIFCFSLCFRGSSEIYTKILQFLIFLDSFIVLISREFESHINTENHLET